jgi:beta-hydroxylase
MSAASSPNAETDQTGLVNKLTHYHWIIDHNRRAFKKANRTAYKATKFGLVGLAIVLFIVW